MSGAGNSRSPQDIPERVVIPRDAQIGEQPGRSGVDPAVMTGAAVVGGVAATIVAGPILGVAAAGGAAYAATRGDQVGDAAKATGNAAIAVGQKAQELDREHQITRKVGEAAQGTWRAVNDFNQKHDVSGKVVGGIASAANGISKLFGKPPERS